LKKYAGEPKDEAAHYEHSKLAVVTRTV